jgi:aspartyl-tRNA(Asn)/glutamyl-tRNA(Gln) amidotransferase subunit A
VRDEARRLAERRTRAVALIEQALEPAEGHPAFVSLDRDRALAVARAADAALDAGVRPGPLTGIPWSIKDLYGVAGHETRAGTPRPLPESWTREGPIVRELGRQLAPIVGKTHTVELAFGGIGTNPHYPVLANPWDRATPRVPGGSSAGAGVSVALGVTRLALGTDTAGSARIPAAYNGVAGLKTTKGRWSTEGIVPLSPTLDSPGVIAADVADLAYAFFALDDPARADERLAQLEAASTRPPRLARGSAFFWEETSPGVAEAVDGALDEAVRTGARCVEAGLPEAEDAYELFLTGGPVAVELTHLLDTELEAWWPTLDPRVAARVEGARSLSAGEYIRRCATKARLARSAATRFAGVDAIVTPTVAITPPPIADVEAIESYVTANALVLRNTSVANYLGLCALSMPVGRDAAGMPVGMQLVAPARGEEGLLAAALHLERTLGDGRQRLGT